MAELGGDARLMQAHQIAVGEALQELESYAATRVPQDGANADRITGNLVVAVYHHDCSRELDPYPFSLFTYNLFSSVDRAPASQTFRITMKTSKPFP
jgi:conjugative relaxase-like TrwC/TraI family protein